MLVFTKFSEPVCNGKTICTAWEMLFNCNSCHAYLRTFEKHLTSYSKQCTIVEHWLSGGIITGGRLNRAHEFHNCSNVANICSDCLGGIKKTWYHCYHNHIKKLRSRNIFKPMFCSRIIVKLIFNDWNIILLLITRFV